MVTAITAIDVLVSCDAGREVVIMATSLVAIVVCNDDSGNSCSSEDDFETRGSCGPCGSGVVVFVWILETKYLSILAIGSKRFVFAGFDNRIHL